MVRHIQDSTPGHETNEPQRTRHSLLRRACLASMATVALAGQLLAAAPAAVADTPVGSGVRQFTASGTFTPPRGVYSFHVQAWGAGGGGGGGGAVAPLSPGGGGGGGGGAFFWCTIPVQPFQTYTVTVGQGGTAGAGGTGAGTGAGGAGSPGTATSLTTPDSQVVMSAEGGTGGGGGQASNPGGGGPGGIGGEGGPGGTCTGSGALIREGDSYQELPDRRITAVLSEGDTFFGQRILADNGEFGPYEWQDLSDNEGIRPRSKGPSVPSQFPHTPTT
ncbi:glycine-rich domain-containing protein [Streptomyces sp. NPDC015127]|uniref:glycine-rich domain-containing protein n=1 Tax=Streptomyces sp. NPDC015127 TaxID=3364939 RepID=UPI0036F6764A